ncbi:MAG: ricin-type beta-trefoil lectin domain protein [Actinomycetota bacterium]
MDLAVLAGTEVDALRVAQSGQCLDATNPTTGAEVRQVACSAEADQRISFRQVAGGYGYLVHEPSALCLSVGGSRTANSPIQLDTCRAGDASALWAPAEEWTFSAEIARISFRSKLTGYCLAGREDGSMIQKVCGRHDWTNLFGPEIAIDSLGTGGAPLGPADSTYHGVVQFTSFGGDTAPHDVWTYGDIVFYAKPGTIPNDTARQWLAWYARADELYRQVLGRDDFDQVYRATVPEFGRKKMVAFPDGSTCGAGCGNKGKAEADQVIVSTLLERPNDWRNHWIIFYEMGRGGSQDVLIGGKATWPAGDVLVPHLMAGLTYYELGGAAGLERGIPAHFLDSLTEFEQTDQRFDELDQSGGMAIAIIFRITQQTDIETASRIVRNMQAYEEAGSAREAACNFQAAVNTATNGQFAGELRDLWKLPQRC